MSFERHVHYYYVRLGLQLIEPGHLKTQKYTYTELYLCREAGSDESRKTRVLGTKYYVTFPCNNRAPI